MPDHLTPAGRSRVMAAIRSKDTKPELAIRRELRGRGLIGYRLHARKLPGRPDLAYTRWRVAVFVDGVFWHGHPDHFDPDRASVYWRDKIASNKTRDAAADKLLDDSGWHVVRLWDLEILANPGKAADRVQQALGAAGHPRASDAEAGASSPPPGWKK